MRRLYLLLLLSSVMGCKAHEQNLAPVVELKWRSYLGRPATHIVRPGETIYAVAFRYDLDFRELLAYNHLRNPYLHTGQTLRLPHANVAAWQFAPVKKALQSRNPSDKRTATPLGQAAYQTSSSFWSWPAYGNIVNNFNPQQGKKGIDIAGKKGNVIYAAAPGVVAYCGNGLAGYGNLIIIKHNGQFLTAYGNNLRNRVVEGQQVKAGQIIADMGIVERKFWGVHFEIRKTGQPVNPKLYLPRRYVNTG